ncbi:MAG: NAD(P)-dependent oxidoreductase [Mucilaginibacter sp.]|nr:NAD(P)-dependent oxidoreductase [Mucilaginibacter sp.]
MNIAIIGASGFVGSHLLKEALLRGHKVLAIGRHPENIANKNERLTIEKLDIFESDKLSQLLTGQDIVLSAYNPGWRSASLYDDFLAGSQAIQNTALNSGVKRLIVVGGAGSLEISDGLQLVDSPGFPEEWKQGALAARDYLNILKEETNLSWTFLSPAIEMHPGTSGIRTAKYRTGNDQPVFDENERSIISVEDIAVAIMDEVENARFINQRFTVAY